MIVRTAMSATGYIAPYYAARMARVVQKRHDVRRLVNENGLIFVHIPKCGGSSIWKSLQLRKPADGHIPARTWRRLLGPDEFDRLTAFTIVRNPWDRLVSAFHYLKSAPWPDDRRFHNQNLAKIETFDVFCDLLLHDYLFRHRIMSFRHFHKQVYYTDDGSGRRLVSRILRLENVSDDLPEMLQSVGYNGPAELKHENKSERGDYRRYYSDKTAEMVARLYAEDIHAFGYSFDDPEP